MPLYDFECNNCGEHYEMVFKVDEMPMEIRCTNCGFTAKRIIVLGHGGVHGEEAPWIREAALQGLQDSDEVAAGRETPITTRSEYKRHLKAKGIVEKGTDHKKEGKWGMV